MPFAPEDDCFAIRQAARHVSQLYDRHLANVGLTITQFSIMGRIRRAGRLTMKQLADEMVLQRTSLVRAIQPLRRDGLVFTDSLEPEQRALVLGLTKDGEERILAARQHWSAAQDEFEQRFGLARAAALRRELLALTQE
ncbi:MarR family transcriptional regulator [Paraburkholderia sp. BL10I2N1]|uniref:MarR family winged helix-turn-helix transcriptional regulator n=1 Tax=Paraburkholderia sp. BL10I2N1 TaxID=1938796 RepID=UPI00105BA0F2|nr:MarR family transcriptional regulator [Paraburkholderia sp. BL10I2N1]TDN62469.1 MarR family transcriptional regulator [Paraburkholderia sp. BL10I2N1]